MFEFLMAGSQSIERLFGKAKKTTMRIVGGKYGPCTNAPIGGRNRGANDPGGWVIRRSIA